MSPGVDEPRIRTMVETFYARVREDPELGPIFDARLSGRWPAHLDKMVDFWTSALLGAGRYAGNPRAAHAQIPNIDRRHFDRWLRLFEGTVTELFDPTTAGRIQARAQAMANALSRGITNGRPGLPMTETKEHTHVRPPTDHA